MMQKQYLVLDIKNKEEHLLGNMICLEITDNKDTSDISSIRETYQPLK